MTLTLEQIKDYQTHGYLIVEDVFDDEDLQPVIDEISREIDERARLLHAEGKIADLCEKEPFERRFALLRKQCPEIGERFDIMHSLGRAMFDFLRNEKLLDTASCLLGREISCNPIQHLRAKLPWTGEGEQPTGFDNVPWHQDVGVTTEDSEASEIITFWIPLVDATKETGCMQIIPDAFKRGALKHQAEGGTSIVPEQMPEIPPIHAECRKGGIVIMNKYTPHRGTPNRSGIIRWSLDLRYHKTGARSGRDHQPSFVVRSAADPGSVLTDHEVWRRLWTESLRQPAPNRRLHRV